MPGIHCKKLAPLGLALLLLVAPTLALASDNTIAIADFMNSPGRLRTSLGHIADANPDNTYAKNLSQALIDAHDDEFISYDAAIMDKTLSDAQQKEMLAYIISPQSAPVRTILHGEAEQIGAALKGLPDEQKGPAKDFFTSSGMDALITVFSSKTEQDQEQVLADKLVCQQLTHKDPATLKKYKAQGKCKT